ncbi:MAG: Uma2 family endonuclease [Gemmatimonadaceae bacterium]
MPAQAKQWTADQVRELIDETQPSPRYELIDGELLVTPSPTHDHQEGVGRLWQPLHAYVRVQRIGWAFFSPSDVELAPDTIVQPDVFVAPLVDGRRPRGRVRIRTLLLAAEVLSPSSARHDRVTKRRFYQRTGVPEYWVVDLDARIIERWRRGEERAQLVDDRLEWHPDGAVEPFVLDVGRYFAEVNDE